MTLKLSSVLAEARCLEGCAPTRLFLTGCLTMDNSQFLNLLPHLKKKKKELLLSTSLASYSCHLANAVHPPRTPRLVLSSWTRDPPCSASSAEVTGTCEFLRDGKRLKG